MSIISIKNQTIRILIKKKRNQRLKLIDSYSHSNSGHVRISFGKGSYRKLRLFLPQKERKMRYTLNKNKRARNYGLCSAAIALAAVASLGTAGSAKAEEAAQLKDLPNPTDRIEYSCLGYK